VVGAAADERHTAEWTYAGELFTFGDGGHGVQEGEYVPRLVDTLVGKRVIGASAGQGDSSVDRVRRALYLWEWGAWDAGHGGEENELVPRLVQAPLDA
jgi:hypothetical protein